MGQCRDLGQVMTLKVIKILYHTVPDDLFWKKGDKFVNFEAIENPSGLDL